MRRILFFLLVILFIPKLLVLTSGCAQIMSPTGGKRDTLPPALLSARPELFTTNFTGNRIILNFDEYIELQKVRENLLVSPTPKNDPYVDHKLKTVTIRIRDTLEANTTYTVDLGDAIQDINEGNILKDFAYVFSTGAFIDSLTFNGSVRLAETGMPDSTLQVYLYNNFEDSAVYKQKPRYIARVDSSGYFYFRNIAPGAYNVFALKDGDGSKTYNSKTELFAFADSTVSVNENTAPVNLYAYAEEKERPRATRAATPVEKRLKYTARIPRESQDVLSDLVIEFNKPLQHFDTTKILLTDTLHNIYETAQVSIDSTSKKVSIKNTWMPDSLYELIILKEIGSDSTGLVLPKSDTLRFKARGEAEYGSIKINFINLDKAQNPVLQFVKNNEVVKSYPLPSSAWSATLFEPGEYDLRILYDANGNGHYDPGNYDQRLQPEKVYAIRQKLSIRANWENERDIELP